MPHKIQILDCTLRDGSYINDSKFGERAIKGIIQKLQEAKIDIIECGWLKDSFYDNGSTYYHVPDDALPYFEEKDPDTTYVAMIDYNRYNVGSLPQNNGKTIDAIRIVFPRGKCKEGAALAGSIRDKGYRVYMQAANTLGYSDRDLLDLIDVINDVKPEGISIVDTFGAMYPEDLERMASIFLNNLDENIMIGFHSHNNMQLSFALSMQFIKRMKEANRACIVDSSLCGMGRGAGNTTTELLTSFLNRSCHGNYDLDAVMDAIDVYMIPIQERYKWGYSTPFFIAGLYCCHVNNIDYLLENHRTNAREMREIIGSLEPAMRLKYDYDYLEEKFIKNQNQKVEDEESLRDLKRKFEGKELLLVAPGKSIITSKEIIKRYQGRGDVISISVNALIKDLGCDYLFITNTVRYDYAKNNYSEMFNKAMKILLSNVKTIPEKGEIIIRYERSVKRGNESFDNAVICLLRLLNRIEVERIAIAGFDKYEGDFNKSYADRELPAIHGDRDWDAFNEDIKEAYREFRETTKHSMRIKFLTNSEYISEYDEHMGDGI